jgi:fumarylacetoacetase
VIDETHDPKASSWVPGADAHPDFPVQNLPLGMFSTSGTPPRAGVAIGDHVLDLTAAAAWRCGTGQARRG